MRHLVIGSGPNGLAAAFYLAKAGHRPIVLEKSRDVGGGAATVEIHPGFRAPVYSHEILLEQRIVRDMDLAAHGLGWIRHDVEACALSLEGPPLVIYHDVARTAHAMRRINAADAEAWPRYRALMSRVSETLAPLLAVAPPAGTFRPGDLLDLLRTGRRFHRLGDEARQLLRWLPMSIFDFTEEWFDQEQLRACIAGRAVSGSMLGPRSGWTSLLLFLREAHAALAGGGPLRAAGGPGACTQAMAAAARRAGAEIRTGAAVERILGADNRVTGVVLEGGESIATDSIISTLDPGATLLALLDRDTLPDEIAERVLHYRDSGTLAKVNLALDALPRFRGIDDAQLVSGRIHIGEQLDDLERAFDAVKYGQASPAPWLEMQIPSLLDPSLAPSGRHVASIYVHSAPFTLQTAHRDDERRLLLERTLATVERYAPGFTGLVREARIATPSDLASALGSSHGHVFHGELVPDQLLALRPVFGVGRYRTPVAGLYLGGGSTHPGGFLTGTSGRLAAQAVVRS